MKRHVLLAEDDAQTVQIIEFVLSHAGYVVKVASNGYDALDLVSQYSFDLVLLDINMPMMGGFDFLERFSQSEEATDTLVVMLTVRNDKESIVRAKKLGADQYIVKPIEKNLLLDKIEVSLGGRPQCQVYSFSEGSESAQTSLNFSASIDSISETGMVLIAPIAFSKGRIVTAVESQLFMNLGVVQPRLRVAECEALEGDEERYRIYFSFVDMAEDHIGKVREWVVGQCLKRSA